MSIYSHMQYNQDGSLGGTARENAEGERSLARLFKSFFKKRTNRFQVEYPKNTYFLNHWVKKFSDQPRGANYPVRISVLRDKPILIKALDQLLNTGPPIGIQTGT